MNSSDIGRPFSDEELAELRLMLEEDRRAKWVWATLRVWAGWGLGLVAAYIAAKALFTDTLSKLMK